MKCPAVLNDADFVLFFTQAYRAFSYVAVCIYDKTIRKTCIAYFACSVTIDVRLRRRKKDRQV